MSNPLRGPDAPYEPYAKIIVNESETGTRHPARFETTQSTIRDSQMNAIVAAQISRVAPVSLTTGDVIVWDTKQFDEKGLWNGSTTITIPFTGKNTGPWLFHCKVTWPGTGAGTVRQLDIMQNAVSIATMQGPPTTMGQEISVLVWNPLNTNAYTVQITHDDGGVLVMNSGATNMFFEVHHPY